jgi:hypothetical protein
MSAAQVTGERRIARLVRLVPWISASFASMLLLSLR